MGAVHSPQQCVELQRVNRSMNQSLSVSGNRNPYYLGLKESKNRKKIYMYIKNMQLQRTATNTVKGSSSES